MKIRESLNSRFDFYIFIPYLILVTFSLLAIFSSTINQTGPVAYNFYKQAVFAILSVFILYSVYKQSEGFFESISFPLYVFSIILLIAVLLVGKTINNSKSWLSFGIINFQPSELAKIATILYLSKYLSDKTISLDNLKDLAKSIFIGILPVVLILLENDTGTSFVFIVFIFFIFFMKGLNPLLIIVLSSPFLIIFASMFGIIPVIIFLIIILVTLILLKPYIIIATYIFLFNVIASFFFQYIFNILSAHQKKRVEVFLNPEADPKGAGYNIIQVKVAIGSGGLFGKGFMNGNQTQLRFVPEQWTDFIYSVIGEEWGFIGSVLVIFSFALILTRISKLFLTAHSEFSRLVSVGIFGYMFFHFFVNIGMCIGLFPVIGIPLPFVSYGGSALLFNSIALGIILSFYKHKVSI